MLLNTACCAKGALQRYTLHRSGASEWHRLFGRPSKSVAGAPQSQTPTTAGIAIYIEGHGIPSTMQPPHQVRTAVFRPPVRPGLRLQVQVNAPRTDNPRIHRPFRYDLRIRWPFRHLDTNRDHARTTSARLRSHPGPVACHCRRLSDHRGPLPRRDSTWHLSRPAGRALSGRPDIDPAVGDQAARGMRRKLDRKSGSGSFCATPDHSGSTRFADATGTRLHRQHRSAEADDADPIARPVGGRARAPGRVRAGAGRADHTPAASAGRNLEALRDMPQGTRRRLRRSTRRRPTPAACRRSGIHRNGYAGSDCRSDPGKSQPLTAVPSGA